MKKLITKIFFFLLIAGCGEGYLEDFPVPEASTVPEFSIALSNEGFAPAEAQFTNESIIPQEAGNHSYQWTFGDGTSSTEENPTHTYQSAGRYTVKLIITTERGIETEEKIVVVKNPAAEGRRLYFGDRNSETFQLAIINEDVPINFALPGDPVARPYGLAVDTINQFLYMADFGGGVIYRADLEGNNREIFRTGLAGPSGLALDLASNNLFWTTDDGVQKADLNDNNVDQVETLVTGNGDDPEGLTLDRDNQKIYYVTYNGGLFTVDYDGSNDSELIPDVLGAAALIVENNLFFHSYDLDASQHTLKVADLNGNVEGTIASGMDGDIYGIAFNPDDNKIYWNDQRSGQVVRANLDGTDNEVFLEDNTARIYAVAIGNRTE